MVNSESFTLSWLGKTSVHLHLLLETDEHLLQGVGTVPALHDVELGGINYSIVLVDTGEVDLGLELDLGWAIRVVHISVDLATVNSVFELGAIWSKNGSVPVEEILVIRFIKTIRNSLVIKFTVLCELHFFEESECSRHRFHFCLSF